MEQHEKNPDAFKRQKAQRLEALTDGVFAIVMTLLVLDLRIPASEIIHSEPDMQQALISILPKIITYALTFWVAGLFWSVYSNQYNYINKADSNLTMISIFFLMFVALLPFSAAQLSEHIELRTSAVFYCGNVFISCNLMRLHWQYAIRHGLTHVEDDMITVINKGLMKRAITASIIYGICFTISFFSSYVSIGLIILVQTYYAFIGFFVKDKKVKKAEQTN